MLGCHFPQHNLIGPLRVVSAPFDLSVEGFASCCHLRACLENHQTPFLPAALQRLFPFSGEPAIVCRSLKGSFRFRQEPFGWGQGEPNRTAGEETAAWPRSRAFPAASYLLSLRFCESLHKQTEYLDYALIWTRIHIHYIPLSH